MWGKVLTTVAAALLLLVSTPAIADKAEAKTHFKNGVELFKDANYEGALVEFKAAYEAQPHFKVRYNIGTSLYKLHRYVEAKAELDAYIAEGDDKIPDKDRLEVQGILYEIQSLIGTITVTCTVQGARVAVNGKEVGPCPFTEPLQVNLGEHDVQVTAIGYKTFEQTVTVAGGKAVVVNASLSPVTSPIAPVKPGLPPEPAAPDSQSEPAGYLTVEAEESGTPFEVFVDGTSIGAVPLHDIALPPGEHKVAVISTKTQSHYQTIYLAEDQTVHIKPEKERIPGSISVRIGGSLLLFAGVVVPVLGILFATTDESKPERRELLATLMISGAVMAGVGVCFFLPGLVLVRKYRKKDKMRRGEYLADSPPRLSIAPFVLPVEGGGVAGLTLVF